MNSGNWIKGIGAGFAATILLSALMLLKAKMALMPELNPIQMINDMMHASSPAMGWMAHFMIGAILWGSLFAWLNPVLPGHSQGIKGIAFGIAAWLMMMVVVMPMAGAGLFGIKMGMMAPIMTLMLHVIFGFVLGYVYSLEKPQAVARGTR